MKKNINFYLTITLAFFIMLAVSSCNSPDSKKNTEDSATSDSMINDDDITDTEDFEEIIVEEDVDYDALGAISYKLDCDSSKIIWTCVTHIGYTKFKSGEVKVIDGEIVSGDLEIIMDSISNVDIDYILMREVLENTLKSEDFFDVKKYPFTYFHLVRNRKISDSLYEIIGNLTIKETTNQIRLNSTFQNQDSTISVVSEPFSFNRTKWGITIYSENFPQTDNRFLFTDLVELQISLRLKKEIPSGD